MCQAGSRITISAIRGERVRCLTPVPRIALIVATVALSAVVAPQPASAQDALPPIRIGNGIPQPRKVKDVKPVYPPDAQADAVQGVVIIEATIGPTGLVLDTHVLRSIPMLDAAALDAVRQWEFTPTVVDGVARSVIMTVTVNFALSAPGAPAAAPPPPAPSSPAMVLLTTAPKPDGSRLVFEIPIDRAERLPRWDQRITLEPPLSMGDARKAADAWLRGRSTNVTTFELATGSLFRAFPRPPNAGACGASGCWYYRLGFVPMAGDRRLAGGSDFTSVVLLDGSVVEPRTEAVVTGGGRGAAPAAAPPTSTPIDRGPGGIYRQGDSGIVPPRVVKEVKPNYTSDALHAAIGGTVVLEATVAGDGTMSDVKVVRSLDTEHGLDNEAVKAARAWRFTPATRLGVPVPMLVRIELEFTVRK